MLSAPIITVFNTLPGGLLVTDLTSRVLYANEAVAKRTGYAVPEIIGKKPGELWGGHMPRSFYTALWQTIGTEEQPFIGRFENEYKGGKRNWETLQIAPIKNRQGVTEYFIELHPAFQTASQERTFQQQFLHEAPQWHQEPSVWQHFLSLLQSSVSREGFETEVAQSDVAEFLREELILPTQAKLARRFEDTALIRAAQEDTAAFALLYEKYVGLIEQYFVRRMASRQEAEDLTQEVFIRAFRALPKFRIANASYHTYLLHVAHNLLVDSYRRSAKTQWWNRASFEEVVGETILPDLESLDTLLASLSPIERSVMLLTYRDGFKAREIAEKLGKTENAIKLILSRSRQKLRSVLA